MSQTLHNIRDHALIEGFTLWLMAYSAEYTLELYVKPDAALGGRFTAICGYTGETLRVNGWLFDIDTALDLAA